MKKPELDPRLEAENPTGDMAMVGESDRHHVSMQALQAIYNEITGKTESLSRQFTRPFRFHLNDFEQLNHKIEQSLEQYHIEATNLTVKLYHLNDTQETFSSFERFRIYNQSATSPIESVLLKYNFMVILPRTRQMQSYTISVRVVSRIAAVKGLRVRNPGVPREVFKIIGGPVGMVTIDYVDYTVARTFMGVIEGWFDTLEIAPRSLLVRALTAVKEAIPVVSTYFILGAALVLAVRRLPFYIGPNELNLLVFGRYLLISMVLLYIAARLGGFIGMVSRNAVEDWQVLAYIRMNRGDEKEIEAVTAENRTAIIKAILSLAASFVIGLAASLVAVWITTN